MTGVCAQRRRRALRAALLFAGVAVLALSCRREAPPSSPPAAAAAPAPAVESADAARTPRPAGGAAPVIWLGLDGLDFEILDRLSSEGKMPNWTRLVSEGASGRLTSFVPILSPVLWTTAATGVGPDIHRVLDFQEVDPATGQKVPISGLSRAVPAVWNLASAAGRRVGVVGWWATHPAEEVEGFFVSDHASPILFEKLPLSGAAYPASLESGLPQVLGRDGRVAPSEIAALLGIPESEVAAALSSGAGMENPVVALSRILAQTRVYHRIARDLYDRNHPDLMALYLEGTDEIGHVFASFVPPKLDCVSDQDFARFSRVVDAYYALVDRILGQWMRRASEDGATLLVQSDHGFKWGSDRPCTRSSLNWATAGFWHRLDGVYAFWGKGVRAGGSRGKASLFDVAPTVLALLGLPADTRMSGHAIASAFDRLQVPPARAQFEGLIVRRAPAQAMSAEEASEYAKKLLALGYLSGAEAQPLAPTGGDRPGMTEGAWNNLGLFESDSRKNPAAARRAFEKALELSPKYHSPMFNLAVLSRRQGQYEKAEDWLFRSFAAGHPDPEGTVVNWAFSYQEGGHAGPERRLLERAAREFPSSERVARELSLARFRARDCTGAQQAVQAFEATTNDPDTLNALGLFRTCLGRRDEAIALFRRSLEIKPGQRGVIESLRMLGAQGASPGS